MQDLKRVGWQIGQSLLPVHLIAQEESILAHFDFFIKSQSLPFYGVAQLNWNDTLLMQSVISISNCQIVFSTGEIVEVPKNANIATFDLNKSEKNQLSLYIHLLKGQEYEKGQGEVEEEKITYAMQKLLLSTESHTISTKAVFKLAEFEKNPEGHWKLSESYIPPIICLKSNPFFSAIISQIKSLVESFQKELEHERTTGKLFKQRTMETKLCLMKIAMVRRFLLNVEREVIHHPYYLYAMISEFIDYLALVFSEETDFNIIPYQHEKLAPLFSKLIEGLTKYLKPQNEHLSYLKFEQREEYYVSEKIPQEINDAENCYFVIQPVVLNENLTVKGLKLASYDRLSNIHRFALTGIPLMRLENAPFNNNFSRYAHVYSIEKNIEWEHAMKEKRLAFQLDTDRKVQAFLYWK